MNTAAPDSSSAHHQSALIDLQTRLGYRFSCAKTLMHACHIKNTRQHKENLAFERLEFLGDRVLGLALSTLLYTHFPRKKEGELAKQFSVLVSKKTCFEVASSLRLYEALGQKKACTAAHSHTLSDAMEAVLGGIYLDGGFESALRVVETLWAPYIHKKVRIATDSKTALQEHAQRFFQSIPNYTLLATTGPDHAPHFEVEVCVPGMGCAQGSAPLKKEAEHKAALTLLNRAHGEHT